MRNASTPPFTPRSNTILLPPWRFEKPSAIQEMALPLALKRPPENLLAQAQSGSGKTAAFCLASLARVDTRLAEPQVRVCAVDAILWNNGRWLAVDGTIYIYFVFYILLGYGVWLRLRLWWSHAPVLCLRLTLMCFCKRSATRHDGHLRRFVVQDLLEYGVGNTFRSDDLTLLIIMNDTARNVPQNAMEVSMSRPGCKRFPSEIDHADKHGTS